MGVSETIYRIGVSRALMSRAEGSDRIFQQRSDRNRLLVVHAVRDDSDPAHIQMVYSGVTD